MLIVLFAIFGFIILALSAYICRMRKTIKHLKDQLNFANVFYSKDGK